MAPSSRLDAPACGPKLVVAIATASAAVARLDARVCVSPVASAWMRRACWTGYARALQLQSVEVEEIDIISWSCGIRVPGRPLLATNVDPFDAFPDWAGSFETGSGLARRHASRGREEVNAMAPVMAALDEIRRSARSGGSISPWLDLPRTLQACRASTARLPCLAGGAKALRMKRVPNEEDWLAAVRSVERAAQSGLDRLDALEQHHRAALRACSEAYRAGALPRLLALTFHKPVLSPQAVATDLDMSVAGASKLLDRARDAGFLFELVSRRNWRTLIAEDVAIELGFKSRPRGRPPAEPPPLPPSRELASVFEEFDKAMADIDRLLGRSVEAAS
jgi:hypothetical protein